MGECRHRPRHLSLRRGHPGDLVGHHRQGPLPRREPAAHLRGRRLRTHQIIVELISATTTTTGLTVRCVLDTADYPIGVKYTRKQVDALPITYHDFHGEWNYCVRPSDTP